MDSKKLLIAAIVLGLIFIQYLMGRYLPKLFLAILPIALIALIVVHYQRFGLDFKQAIFLPMGVIFLINVGVHGLKSKENSSDEST